MGIKPNRPGRRKGKRDGQPARDRVHPEHRVLREDDPLSRLLHGSPTPPVATYDELAAMGPDERAAVEADPRVGLVRTSDFVYLDREEVRRGLAFDPDTEVMVVCRGCGDIAAMPAAVVPAELPRDDEGRVEAVCPRCVRGRLRDVD